jgi:hypothetical protein
MASNENWIKCEMKNTHTGCSSSCQECNACVLCPKGKQGIPGVSIVGTYIHEDCLYLQLSNGQRLNAGNCRGPTGPKGEDGNYVVGAVIKDGYLIVYLSDGTEINAGYCLPPESPTEIILEASVSPLANIYNITTSRSALKPATGEAVFNFVILPIVANNLCSFTFEWVKHKTETQGEANWYVQCAEITSGVQCKLISGRKFEVSFVSTGVGHHRICFSCN